MVNETLSISASGLLTGLGVRFLAYAGQKTVEAIKDLVSQDETKSILARSFLEFKENVLAGTWGVKDENVLLDVFEKFFTDDRAIGEFRFVFDAQSEKVDFNLLEEIFVQICIDKGIEIPTFDFPQSISYVIEEIEQLAQRQDKFKELFQTAHLGRIYKSLQTRGTEPNLSYARLKYLDYLKKYHNRLFFAGIPDLKEKKEIQLPAIFVMPRAVENVPVEDYWMIMREKQGDREFTGEEIHMQRMMMVKKEEKSPVKFDKVFAESSNRCFVVLGKPGSGKSTLLKFLVLETARRHLDYDRDSDRLLFPILVEIRKLENALNKTSRTDYNILDFLYDSMRTQYNLTLPNGFFEEYLGSGRALLLFDGLDEVAAEGRRATIQQMISTFVDGYSSSNTVIVTSRIAGYSRAQFSTTDYRHFTLEDFDDEEIEEFIKNWYRSRLANENEADTKAADLKTAFEKKPRIKELARNPLLLTIIGIIHRYEAQLPEDRLVLYDKATEALLYTWDNVKEIIDLKFKLAHRQRFLCQVAIHLQSLEKGDEAGTMIHRNELYKLLLADFCKVFNCDEWGAQELVNDFLETMRTRAGLLVEMGPDRFGFAHKTFQEYFAARWLANEMILKLNLQIMIDYVDRFIDNAFWHETLILALQALPEEHTLNILKYILKRNPRKIEPYFYHNHYFVMKFIAEKGEWLNDRKFVETQIEDFFRFSWDEGKDRGLYGHYTWERFTKWVSSVSDSLVVAILSVKLLGLASDKKQGGNLRKSCAKAVGNLGLKDQAIVGRLLALAEDENHDGYLRRSCAEVLGKLGLKKQAVEILLALACDEKQDGSLRSSCAYTLGNLGFKDQAIVERLLSLATDEKQDDYLRHSCAIAVGNLGLKNQTVVERLLSLACDEKQGGSLRRSCAEAVGNLGLKGKAAEILLALTSDEKHDDLLRGFCAEAMGNLGVKYHVVVDRLLALASDKKQESLLRYFCAKAVGDLGLKDQAVVEQLITLAFDEKQDANLRRSCAKAVGKLGLKDQAVEILLALASDAEQDGSLRRDCAIAAGKLGLKDQALEILIKLYLAEKDKYSFDAQYIYNSLWELTEV